VYSSKTNKKVNEMLTVGAKDKQGSEVVKIASVFFYVKRVRCAVPKCEVMNSNWSLDNNGNWIEKLRIEEDGKKFK
jgi:hypothetical protein